MAAILGLLSSIFGGSIAHIEHVHKSLKLPNMTQRELENNAKDEIKKHNSHKLEGGDYAISGGSYKIDGGDYEINGGSYKIDGGNWFQDHTIFGGNAKSKKGGDYVINGGNSNQRRMKYSDLTK